MVEPMLIDLESRCWSSARIATRARCRSCAKAWPRAATSIARLRDVTEVIKKKIETATGAAAKRWHLKLGIASFFLGYMQQAVEHLRQAEGALANFYLGRP